MKNVVILCLFVCWQNPIERKCIVKRFKWLNGKRIQTHRRPCSRPNTMQVCAWAWIYRWAKYCGKSGIRPRAAGPGARFSKVPRTFRARKAIRKTTTYLFCKAGLLIRCKRNKNKNNCKVSCLETLSFWRYKENYVTRNTPEKFRDFRETGPRPSGWRAARGPWATGHGSAFCKTLQTQQQLDLELPQILAGESDSELNSEHTIHSRWTLN